jgi:hypothetical protein
MRIDAAVRDGMQMNNADAGAGLYRYNCAQVVNRHY